MARTYLDRRLLDKVDTHDLDWIVSPSVVDAFKGKSAEEIRAWFKANRGYLHPGWDAKLEVDKDAAALGAPIDSLEFFDKAIAALRAGSRRSSPPSGATTTP